MGQRGSDLGHEERVRRVLVHASGFRQSPYADIKPQGVDAADTRAQAGQETRKQQETQKETQKEKKDPPSKLWHSSPGSSGW
jgi:error-prone DNA polymerase